MMKNSSNVLVLIFILLLSVTAGVFDYQQAWRPWRLGLDLVGGSYLVYDIDLSKVSSAEQTSVVSGLRDVIERRVNVFGVSEPQVFTTQSGKGSQLVVELAGVKDVNEAIKQIGQTAFLDFREVEIDEEKESITFIATPLNGRYLKRATPSTNQQSGLPEVILEFDSEGGRIFEELTARNVGKPLYIFLDHEPISSPRVNERIIGGRAVITGQFTIDETRQLASLLNAGALPAPINLASQQTIGASLGEASLQKAVLAGVIGTAAVMAFMIIYYRLFGLFASFALLIYISLTLAIFKAIPITLTLAGIAGLVLSIGMAVDANILIFERTKEEIKRGLRKSAAIEEGFRRAWTSIRDSNITTILTSLILYYSTSSFVKGFAFALFLGVLVSMFSAISVTRTFLKVFVK